MNIPDIISLGMLVLVVLYVCFDDLLVQAIVWFRGKFS